jgi:hypothetical protein
MRGGEVRLADPDQNRGWKTVLDVGWRRPGCRRTRGRPARGCRQCTAQPTGKPGRDLCVPALSFADRHASSPGGFLRIRNHFNH